MENSKPMSHIDNTSLPGRAAYNLVPLLPCNTLVDNLDMTRMRIEFDQSFKEPILANRAAGGGALRDLILSLTIITRCFQIPVVEIGKSFIDSSKPPRHREGENGAAGKTRESLNFE